MDISKDRQQLAQLLQNQKELMQGILGARMLIKGGIYKTNLRCGKKGCKCGRGELHEVWMFYRSEGGKTKIRTLSKENAMEYERYTMGYQKYRRARAELVKIQKKQIRLIDHIEEGLRMNNRKIEKKLLWKKR